MHHLRCSQQRQLLTFLAAFPVSTRLERSIPARWRLKLWNVWGMHAPVLVLFTVPRGVSERTATTTTPSTTATHIPYPHNPMDKATYTMSVRCSWHGVSSAGHRTTVIATRRVCGILILGNGCEPRGQGAPVLRPVQRPLVPGGPAPPQQHVTVVQSVVRQAWQRGVGATLQPGRLLLRWRGFFLFLQGR